MAANGNNASHDNTPEPSTGLVLVNYGKAMLVENGAGALHRCVARRKLGSIVCGDRVHWQPSGESEGVVTAIEPRRSALNRTDGADRQRPLAANIDQILVVIGPYPEPHAKLIDRYLVASETVGIEPLWSDLAVNALEVDFFNSVATALQLSPAELAGLVAGDV
mgnify:CR=1 FL=1